jgi:hypothetical protein
MIWKNSRPTAVEVSIPLVEHDEVDLALLQLPGELDQMLQRAAEPIELRHHELIASAVRRQQRLLQLRPGGELPRRGVDEDLLAPGGREGIVLSLGMLVARRDTSITDPHPRQRNANPRWRDIAAYTASVQTGPCNGRRSAELAKVSHERSYADTRYTTLFGCAAKAPRRQPEPDNPAGPKPAPHGYQSIEPAGTTHSQRWPLTAAMRSKSAS